MPVARPVLAEGLREQAVLRRLVHEHDGGD
jgi:hypothetical protein